MDYLSVSPQDCLPPCPLSHTLFPIIAEYDSNWFSIIARALMAILN